MSGNIPSLSSRLRAFIYTTTDDARSIMGSAALGRLAACCTDVTVNSICQSVSDLPRLSPYGLMGLYQRHAVERAWEADAGLVWTYPDTILSDGSLGTVDRHIREGRRASLAQGIAVRADAFLAEAITTTGRLLVDRALKTMHAATANSLWDAPEFTESPGMIYWRDRSGLVMRGWHLGPVLVWPRRRATNFKWTLDGDFLELAVDRDDCAFLDDSDDYLLLELATEKKRIATPVGPASPLRIARWAQKWVKPINRNFIQHPFLFHTGDRSGLTGALEQSARAVTDIESALGKLDPAPDLSAPGDHISPRPA